MCNSGTDSTGCRPRYSKETKPQFTKPLRIIEDQKTVWSHNVGPREVFPVNCLLDAPAHLTPESGSNVVALMRRILKEHFKVKTFLKLN